MQSSVSASTLTPSRIIEKKRDGEELSREQILQFIEGLATGEVADYQASAFTMAVYFNGMTGNETVALTEAMLSSGEKHNLSNIPGAKVDKHSTGGVGDKVSLILAPLAAACGLRVPMMAGRGLGHSGGTIDKLESISGYNTQIPKEEFESILSEVGCTIIGQSHKIAPADKKLYALRDVTGTVECIPLIVASILSKKLAEGTEALVLDVKVGSGAFMKTKSQARQLAKALIQVGKKMNLPCRAILTNMNQPLGYAAGNAIEIRECIEILRNEKNPVFCSTDLRELTIHLCAHMLELGKVTRSLLEGRKLAQEKLSDGSAWRVFQDMVRAHHGDLEQILNPDLLPLSPVVLQWKAQKPGFIAKMNTEALGRILVELGGGRKKVTDVIDPGVGLMFHKKLGAKVVADEPLATVYASKNTEPAVLAELEAQFQAAIEISTSRKPVPKLILEQV